MCGAGRDDRDDEAGVVITPPEIIDHASHCLTLSYGAAAPTRLCGGEESAPSCCWPRSTWSPSRRPSSCCRILRRRSGSGGRRTRLSAVRCSTRPRCGRWSRSGGNLAGELPRSGHPDGRASACREASRVGGRRVCRVSVRAARRGPAPGRGAAAQPFEGHWRARRGEYRVRYTINDVRVEVVVLDIRHRRDAYR